MSYTYNGEPVEMERWWWVAEYNDDTILEQFDDNGYFHKFAEIEWGRLKAFGLRSEHSTPIMILWREGAKPIHFYRNYFLDVGGANIRDKLYCIGYQLNTEKVLVVVMPDDRVIVTDDIDNIILGV